MCKTLFLHTHPDTHSFPPPISIPMPSPYASSHPSVTLDAPLIRETRELWRRTRSRRRSQNRGWGRPGGASVCVWGCNLCPQMAGLLLPPRQAGSLRGSLIITSTTAPCENGLVYPRFSRQIGLDFFESHGTARVKALFFLFTLATKMSILSKFGYIGRFSIVHKYWSNLRLLFLA